MERVLIVGPEDLRPALSKTVLGESDVEYVLARNAAAARKSLREKRTRLVIVALGERKASEQFVKSVRKDARTRKVSLLVLLPTLLPDEEQALRKAGASAALAGRVDPYLWNELLLKLLRVAERRAAAVPVRFWVWYRFSNEEKPVRGVSRNVSVRGMLLEVEQPLQVEPGTRLETEFALPGREGVLRALARVVREEPASARGRRRFAIEFLELTPRVEDRIEAFVRSAREA